jgi:hypothetical protein
MERLQRNELTPWSRVHFEALIFTLLIRKTFYGTGVFIAVV